jgi:mannose-1-phosphate guanylyltransferase
VRALLLAGGLGTRLKPISNILPKCLMPIHGRPLIDIWIARLLKNNLIDRILINTHYKHEIVSDYLVNSTWKNQIEIVHEATLLGTAGTILENKNFFYGKDFFVAHADNLSAFDLSSFIQTYEGRGRNILATMMAFKTDDPSNCGILELENNTLINFFEKDLKATGNLANGAVFIMSEKIFEIIHNLKNKQPDISVDLVPQLLGKINIFENTNTHIDIGNMVNWNLGNLVHEETEPFHPENSALWLKILKNL